MTLLTAKKIKNSSAYSVEDLFSLSVQHNIQNTLITMTLFIPTVSTKDMPWTYTILERHLPSILRSTCFNEEKLPFSTEVRRTEIGHLFEHILLEYLCQEKLLKGFDKAVFSGNTQWNWKRDPRGMFHIYINMHYSDTDIFPPALEKTIDLAKIILRNEVKRSYQSSYSLLSESDNTRMPSLLSTKK